VVHETWGRYNPSPRPELSRRHRRPVGQAGGTGVQPVDADHNRSLRSGVIAAHAANDDVHAQVLSTTYRDDVAPSDPHHHGLGASLEPIGTPIDDKGGINLFSPHNYWRDMEASGLVVA
jgi:uncharacterized protein